MHAKSMNLVIHAFSCSYQKALEIPQMPKSDKDKKLMQDVQTTSDEAARLLQDLEDSSNTLKSSEEAQASETNYSDIYRSSSKKIQNQGFPPSIEPDSPSKQTGLFIGGAIVLGLIFLVSVVSFTNDQVANPGNSRIEYESNTSGSIPYGKALFKSGRTGKTDIIGVTLSKRTNTNGHMTYDAQWADGYKSSYVFWSYGRAEIFSKNGVGNIERTNARYRRNANGDCVITADTGAVTIFPKFDPAKN